MPRPSVLLLAAATALGVTLPALATDPFGPIRIGANRSRYVGVCPVEVVFTGNIDLNFPHPRGFTFNYHWARSDGGKGPVNVVRPSASQNMLVVREPWTVGAPGKHYDLSVRLFVNSGNTHIEQASQVVPVTCR